MDKERLEAAFAKAMASAAAKRKTDQRGFQILDETLQDLRELGTTAGLRSPDITHGDLRDTAVARGFSKEKKDNRWQLTNPHVKRDNRPAEKIVTRDLKLTQPAKERARDERFRKLKEFAMGKSIHLRDGINDRPAEKTGEERYDINPRGQGGSRRWEVFQKQGHEAKHREVNVSIDDLRKKLAASIDPAAFSPLSTTFDYPAEIARQRHRQERAFRLADQVANLSLFAKFPSARTVFWSVLVLCRWHPGELCYKARAA